MKIIKFLGVLLLPLLMVPEADAQLSASWSKTNVPCYGGSSGQITLSVSGGTVPYHYQWSTGATTQNLTNLAAGTYSVTISDSGGGTTGPFNWSYSNTGTNHTILVPFPDALINGVSIDIGDYIGVFFLASGVPVCGGYIQYQGYSDALSAWGDDSMTPVKDGFASNETFNWKVYDVSTGQTVNMTPAYDLTSGLFASGGNFVANGMSGCSLSGTAVTGSSTVLSGIVISQSGALVPTIAGTNVSVMGGNDGAADLSISGGTSPYIYNWSTGATTQDISGLATGVYHVSVSDINGCAASASVTISQPSGPPALAATATTTGVFCNGACTGSIDLIPSGGVSPYTYHWSNGATSQDLNNLCAGTYSVTVSDGSGSAVTGPFSWTYTNTGTNHTLLVPTPGATISGQPISNGDVIGVFYLVAGNPVCGGYIFYQGYPDALAAWGDDSTTPAKDGFSANESFIWKVWRASDGQVVSMTASYDLTSGFFPNGGNYVANGLSGCSLTGTAAQVGASVVVGGLVISQPSAISLTLAGSNVTTTGGSNGAVNLTLSGGSSPYYYVWSNGSSTQDLINLAAGLYSVTVIDAHECQKVASITITQPAGQFPLAVSGSTSSISCYGACTGAIDLIPTGGLTPYSYTWSTGSTSQDLSALCAGVYSVTVTDAGSNGGATGPFNWTYVNTGANHSILVPYPDGLINGVPIAVGDYIGVFFLNNGNPVCGGYIQYQGFPDAISAWADDSSTPAKDGFSNNESFIWKVWRAATGETVNMTATYDLTSGFFPNGGNYVSNGMSGCSLVGSTGSASNSVSASFTLTQPAVLATGGSVVGTCSPQTTGSIDAYASGGVPPYGFHWSTGAITEDIGNLAAGTYGLTVTDASGCSSVSGYVVHGNNCSSPWTYTITGGNHSILIPASAVPVINGYPIQPGDYIGVFFQGSSGWVCGGYVIWSGSNTACTAWGLDNGGDGFANGEAFKWMIWDQSANESYVATATYDPMFPNGGYFVVNGISGLASLSAKSIEVVNWISPVSGCDLFPNEVVQVQVHNPNQQTVSAITLSYSINGGPEVTQTFSTPVAAGASAILSFSTTADFSTPQSYVCLARAFNQNPVTATVQSYPLPELSITGLAAGLCVNHSPVSLVGSPSGGTFSGPGVTGNSFSIATAGIGTHAVGYSYTDQNGCSNQISQSVEGYGLPVVSFSGLLPGYCSNSPQSLLVGQPEGGDFTGSGVSDGWFHPSTAGTGLVTVVYSYSDVHGCSAVSSQTSSVTQAPQPAFVALPSSVCDNDALVVLSANPAGGSFTGNGVTGNNFNPQGLSGVQTVHYAVIQDGCLGEVDGELSVHAAPVPNLGPDQVLCQSEGPVVLNPGTFAGYSWSTGASTPELALSAPGNYQIAVTVTNAFGCVAADQADVRIWADPVLNLGPDASYCASGLPVVLDGGPGFSYFWSTGSSSQSIAITGTGIHTIYLLVYDSHGCSAYDTTVISVYENPVVNIGTDQLIAANETALLDAGAGFSSYQWSNGSTQSQIQVNVTGSYQVSVTNSQGCSGYSNSVFVEVGPWARTITGTNHTILVPETASLVNGLAPVSPGDFIGVFFNNNGTMTCGGFAKWMGTTVSIAAWGDDSFTPEKDGFSENETFSWRIYDVSQSAETPAIAYYSGYFPNAGAFTANGISGLDSLRTFITQNVSLHQGWNLFSTYVNPQNPAIASLMSGIVGSVLLVKNDLGALYWPAYNVNLIGNILIGEGYQAKMSQAAVMPVTGQPIVPQTTPVNLSSGWNIMGYIRNSNGPIASLLSSLTPYIYLVKDESGSLFWPAYNVNLIVTMQVGKAYQIKMNSAQVFYYPANAEAVAKEGWTEAQPCMEPTGNNMTLGLPAEFLAGLGLGSDLRGYELVVTGGIGQTVGLAREMEGFVALSLWGDDELTPVREGLLTGESFTLWLVSPAGNRIAVEVQDWETGSDRYSPDQIAIAKAGRLLADKPVSPEIYPNPATETASLRLRGAWEGPLTLTCVDVTGKVLWKKVLQLSGSNDPVQELPVRDWTPGAYLLKVEGAGQVQALPLLVQKP